MATQKMTQVQALAVAIDAVEVAIGGKTPAFDQADLLAALAVLTHMEGQKTKPRAKTEGMTKQQMAALALAKQVAVFVRAQPEGVTSKQVVEGCGLPEVGSTQKAAHLLKLCAQHGWLTRVEVKSKVLWVAGDTPVA